MYPSLPEWTPQNQACSSRIFTKKIQSIFSVFCSNDFFFISNTLRMTTVQPTQKIQVSQGMTTEPKLCSLKEACCLHHTGHVLCEIPRWWLSPDIKCNSDINDVSATAAPSLKVSSGYGTAEGTTQTLKVIGLSGISSQAVLLGWHSQSLSSLYLLKADCTLLDPHSQAELLLEKGGWKVPS